MNDHTIEAYLNRRTTGQLQAFLWQCMHKKLWDQYADTVPLVFDVLQKRGMGMDTEVLSSWKNYRARNTR